MTGSMPTGTMVPKPNFGSAFRSRRRRRAVHPGGEARDVGEVSINVLVELALAVLCLIAVTLELQHVGHD